MNRIAHRPSQSGPGWMTIAVCLPPLAASHAEGTLPGDEDEYEETDRWDDDGGAGRRAGRLTTAIGPAREPRRSP